MALNQAERWINARRVAWQHRLDRVGDVLPESENG
jgi:hypothetical protein